MVFSMGDQVIGRHVFKTGTYDFPKFEDAMKLLERTRVKRFIDVGAHIGVVSIPAVVRGLADTAIAIEPDPLNFRLLECNVRLNDAQDRVSCVQVAVGSDSSGCDLFMRRSLWNHGDHRVVSLSTEGAVREGLVRIPSTTMDELIELPDAENDLLWMDVQGFEIEVLRGARAILASGVPIVLEIFPAALSQHSTLSDLADLLGDYEAFIDLTSGEKRWLPIASLNEFVSSCERDDKHTDILVV